MPPSHVRSFYMKPVLLLPLAALLAGCPKSGPSVKTPTPTPIPTPIPTATPEPDPETPTPETPVRTVELEPLRIDVVETDKGLSATVYDARTLLDDGNDALMQRRFDEALAAYDHLLTDFPDSKLALPAIYNAGLALEGKRDFGGAADRYRRLMTLSTRDSVDYLDAEFRLGRVLVEVAQYTEVEKVFAHILERDDLVPADRIEALAWQGQAQVAMKDYVAAEETLRSALAFYRSVQATDPIDTTYFAAMCQYFLAEIPDRQFREVPLRYPETQLAKDLEHKSQRFLLAQDRYVKAVEYKDPYWATRAVHRIGVMYKEFWDAWMAVPIPADFNDREAKEYIKQVNEEPQLRKLLEKALLYHERNINMARNANLSTEWSESSKVQAEGVRRLIAAIQRGEYVTPGPEAAKAGAIEPSPGAAAPSDYIPGRVEL